MAEAAVPQPAPAPAITISSSSTRSCLRHLRDTRCSLASCRVSLRTVVLRQITTSTLPGRTRPRHLLTSGTFPDSLTAFSFSILKAEILHSSSPYPVLFYNLDILGQPWFQNAKCITLEINNTGGTLGKQNKSIKSYILLFYVGAKFQHIFLACHLKLVREPKVLHLYLKDDEK